MSFSSPGGNGLPEKGRSATSSTGRHARPASAPASALSDLLRDRSLDRIRAADRAMSDAHARIRGTGADSDAAIRRTMVVPVVMAYSEDQRCRPRLSRGLYRARLRPSAKYPVIAAAFANSRSGKAAPKGAFQNVSPAGTGDTPT